MNEAFIKVRVVNYRRWLLIVIVGLALIVIFRPILFKSQGPQSQPTANDPTNISIPQQNKTKAVIDTQAVKKDFANQTNPMAYQVTKPKTARSQPVKQVEQIYSLQVANFEQESRAKAKVKQLRSQGYAAYGRQRANRYVVYIGPILGKEAMLQIKAKFEGQTKKKAVVKEYKPLKDLP